jgi:4'-phosphopantetheinyl transferase
LARYTHEEPRAISIRVEASGKPTLEAATGIHFNISHTVDIALIAVSRGLRVGIDIERVRKVQEMKGILNDFFSEQEQRQVASCSAEERTQTFFRLWTRREATAKAIGLGIFDSFTRFSLPPFDFTPTGFRLELSQPGQESSSLERWWVLDLSPAPGCVGALCVEKRNPTPLFWELALL